MTTQTPMSRLHPFLSVGFFLMILFCHSGYSAKSQNTGDLLFVRSRDSEMEKAISASTGGYTHVAFVVHDHHGVWVYEADYPDGVKCTSYIEWTAKYAHRYDIFRLTVSFDTARLESLARAYLNLPYDVAFRPNDDAFYCSELIYECFKGNDGEYLFEAKPMNWRDANGEIPEYWVEHFRKLGIPVPEGVPGTNPTDMARSPLLRKM